MTRKSEVIPVDLKNPGQVLACMGFLEAAEVLCGGVEANFDWSAAQTQFVLSADGYKNPFEVVLDFLSQATVIELTPVGYVEGSAADGDNDDETSPAESEDEASDDDAEGDARGTPGREPALAFPSTEGDRNALPIQLVGDGVRLTVSHWADGSSRDDFKLYSGNRSANCIATQMLQGVRAKPKKNQWIGDIKNRGLQQLWQEKRDALLKAPFEEVPMGGSFNFDPRGAWTAIDAGYSPNTQKDGIAASPVVEILAAIGLEHTRLKFIVTEDEEIRKKVRYGTGSYAAWGSSLPPMLARAALAGANLKVPIRRFEFALIWSGKNKLTTFAQETQQ